MIALLACPSDVVGFTNSVVLIYRLPYVISSSICEYALQFSFHALIRALAALHAAIARSLSFKAVAQITSPFGFVHVALVA